MARATATAALVGWPCMCGQGPQPPDAAAVVSGLLTTGADAVEPVAGLADGDAAGLTLTATVPR